MKQMLGTEEQIWIQKALFHRSTETLLQQRTIYNKSMYQAVHNITLPHFINSEQSLYCNFKMHYTQKRKMNLPKMYALYKATI